MAKTEKHIKQDGGLTARDQAMQGTKTGLGIETPSAPTGVTEAFAPPVRRIRGGRARGRVAAGVVGALALGSLTVAALRDSGQDDGESNRGQAATTQVTTENPTTSTTTAPARVEMPVLTAEQQEQATVDKILRDGGYPEMVGQKPLFRYEISTDNSITHVVSFMPEELLPADAFSKDGATATIRKIEDIAAQKKSFTWNPSTEGGAVATRQYVPRSEDKVKDVDYVFFASDADAMPQKLVNDSMSYPLLKGQIDGNRSVFWTTFGDNGSSSFIRWVKDSTSFQYNIPTSPDGQVSSVRKRIGLGFVLETVLAKGKVTPYDYDAEESFKNTVGPGFVSGQYGDPVSYMEPRFGTPFSPTSPRRHLPDSEELRSIFAAAAKVPPAIKE